MVRKSVKIILSIIAIFVVCFICWDGYSMYLDTTYQTVQLDNFSIDVPLNTQLEKDTISSTNAVSIWSNINDGDELTIYIADLNTEEGQEEFDSFKEELSHNSYKDQVISSEDLNRNCSIYSHYYTDDSVSRGWNQDDRTYFQFGDKEIMIVGDDCIDMMTIINTIR